MTRGTVSYIGQRLILIAVTTVLVASSASVVGYSIPSFVIAIFALLLAGHYFYVWTGGTFYYVPGWGKLEQVPVPALALGIPYASYVARLTRASMLETIRTDYVRT